MRAADKTLRGFGLVLVIGVAMGLTVACGNEVTGIPVATNADTRGHVDRPLGELLPTPAQFPAVYPAVVLPPQAASAAAGDLDGVGTGASVEPVDCVPPGASETEPVAVAVGTNEASRVSVTVELARSPESVAHLREWAARCAVMRVVRAGASSTVTTTLSETTLNGADDAVSLRRTVVPDVGGAGLAQTMQTTVGQVADVRITVTAMGFGASQPDAGAVDELFAVAVGNVAGS
ncbi:sensor domain-containing protein [Nocardia camponoti]|uniref:sensor domain-containing protein n=1 Tax=Nocardia camponoti TaxID=1616106 RepID=UPI001E410113|nr:sensor domain-containing protein [Nocardia camponoti]